MYHTKSLNVAAYLNFKNHEVVRIEKDSDGKALIYFNRTKQLDQDVREYLLDERLQGFISSFSIIKKKINKF